MHLFDDLDVKDEVVEKLILNQLKLIMECTNTIANELRIALKEKKKNPDYESGSFKKKSKLGDRDKNF